MSTSIVYVGRARVDKGEVVLEVAAAASNVRPMPGKEFGRRDSDFYEWGRFAIGDLEGMASGAESFARDYDGRCINERYREYAGDAAYWLWAGRIKRVCGVELREPRLSRVFWDGVPGDVTGRGQSLQIGVGERFGYERGCEIVRAGVSLRVKVRDGVERVGRLGFFNKGDGELCYYTAGSKRRGYVAGERCTFVSLENSRGSRWGDFIGIVPVVGKTIGDVCRDVDGFVVRADDSLFLFGRHEDHRLAKLAPRQGVPTVFTGVDGERVLSRLGSLIPEYAWRLVSLSEIEAAAGCEQAH